MSNYLSSVAEELNSKPCSFCGKIHKVSFEIVDTSAALPSLLFPNFSEDSCDNFKVFVKNHLKTL